MDRDAELMLPHLVLMPGLYGTGELFGPFSAILPASVSTTTIGYPPDAGLDFSDLVDVVLQSLPRDKKYVLVAESFSGPIALRVAAAAPAGLSALVLSTSFITAPVSGMLRFLKRRFGTAFFGAQPREFALRYFLLGREAPHGLVRKTADIVRALSPNVLSSRADMALNIDVEDDLRHVQYPILYLRGTRDRLIRHGIADEMLLIRPEMRLRNIEGPHCLLQTKPYECWQAIREFLADAGPEGAIH